RSRSHALRPPPPLPTRRSSDLATLFPAGRLAAASGRSLHRRVSPFRAERRRCAVGAAMKGVGVLAVLALAAAQGPAPEISQECQDRKSTRLNSSHVAISYAVFC